MKNKKIVNISQASVPLKFAGGGSAMLPSGSTIENVSITNETELKGKIAVTRDLAEVNEKRGKQQLRD